MNYIYQKPEWPNFIWNKDQVLPLLLKVKRAQGDLIGKMKIMGSANQNQAILTSMAETVMTSSEIEGQLLNFQDVRSSIARKLGIISVNKAVSRDVEGIVEATLDAVKNYDKKLTKSRLQGWHGAMFPTGYSGMYKIEVGKYRTDKLGPMQVISGAYGLEKIHYEAPAAKFIAIEMKRYLDYINFFSEADNIIKAGIAHLWFVILHPFDDGNGRIARIITDMLLSRSDESPMRFYSMSSQIKKKRKEYYDILEKTQKGGLDVTNWLLWFLETLFEAIEGSNGILQNIFLKSKFWYENADKPFNERQRKIINMLFDNFEGKLTSAKWAKICKCSQDTATNDINNLISLGILTKHGEARATHYCLTAMEPFYIDTKAKRN